MCRRILGNDHDALDATQEALIAITRGIGSFDGRAQFSTWCYRVATNAALDESPAPEPAAPTGRILAGGCCLTNPPTDARVADVLDVDAALARLPEEHRAAVALRDLAGLDYAEIAAVLGIPPGTVRSRIARGRAALARLGEPGHRRRTSKPETPVNTPMDPLTPDAVDELLSAEIDGEFDAAALDLGYEPADARELLEGVPGVSERRAALTRAAGATQVPPLPEGAREALLARVRTATAGNRSPAGQERSRNRSGRPRRRRPRRGDRSQCERRRERRQPERRNRGGRVGADHTG